MSIRVSSDAPAGSDRPVPVGCGQPAGQAAPAAKADDADRASQDYRTLLESVFDGVLVTDPDGRVQDFNARALELLDVDAAALSGMPLGSLLSRPDDLFMSGIRRKLLDRKHILWETDIVKGDRSVFPVEIAVTRLDLNGTARLCFFIRDITVRKRAQEALENAVTRLEAHDTTRLQFISNVSHELRTPLTSMIYAVNNMLAGVVGPVSDRVQRYLEILEGDCKRLLATVNDILDLRKLDSETLTLAKSRAPLVRLVQRSVASLAGQAQRKGLGLSVTPQHGRWFVECDLAKMERVFLNVVGNAIKFTPAGGRVEVSIGDDPDRNGMAAVNVRDNGIGIPAEALNKVTVRYFTVGEQATGSGLGLAISKEIVALHGGRLDIQSPPPGFDQGTAVRINLATVPPPTVLIVDDSEAILELLADQVALEGYRILRAENGEEAVRLVTEHKPNVIVLDLVLPDMDGTELILKLRSEKTTMASAIIVVTGAVISEAKEEILRSFDIPTLTKPWNEGELLDAVAEVFMRNAARGRQTG